MIFKEKDKRKELKRKELKSRILGLILYKLYRQIVITNYRVPTHFLKNKTIVSFTHQSNKKKHIFSLDVIPREKSLWGSTYL